MIAPLQEQEAAVVQDGFTIAVERFAAVRQEASALLLAHWREIARYSDIELNIADQHYAAADADGRLCIVTARSGGQLVGYAVFFVGPHPHYQGSVQALQDIFYLTPSVRARGWGRRLIRESERILRARGVQVVHHHVKLAHPVLGGLLRLDGYEAVETMYSKRLDGGT